MPLNLPIDDSSDQVARDHEKNINPDESTPESFGKGMEKDDRQNGKSPQPINILSIERLIFQADASQDGGSISRTWSS